jgi:hypothetical protein
MRGPNDGTRTSSAQGVDIDLGMMAAGLTGHEQSRAVLAHVPKRHRVDWFVILGHLSKIRTDRERNQAA